MHLASPTGRAAKRLAEVTGHEASTLHRLLEWNPREGGFQRNARNPLGTDVIVVDEVSMIDVLLAHHLAQAIPLTATLLLVGDADQLPSVGPGTVLKDLLAVPCIPAVRLTTIFRQAAQSRIVANAHRVNRGEFPDLSVAAADRRQDFFFIAEDDPPKLQDLTPPEQVRVGSSGGHPGAHAHASRAHRGGTAERRTAGGAESPAERGGGALAGWADFPRRGSGAPTAEQLRQGRLQR
jgi:ATP-dependent exoDNAse (exonuclease V) alpha subunit